MPEDDPSVIFAAVEDGDPAAARRLLNAAPELAKAWRLHPVATPLHGCLRKPEIARLLLEHGADVNAIDSDERRVTPLHICAQYGDVEMVKLLLEYHADVTASSHGGTSLHRAVTGVRGKLPKDFAEVVALLLDAEANINACVDPDTDVWTPLHQACNEGHLGAVRLLLERGAQVSLHKDGLTPLLVAEGNGFDDIAALLRELGARPVE